MSIYFKKPIFVIVPLILLLSGCGIEAKYVKQCINNIEKNEACNSENFENSSEIPDAANKIAIILTKKNEKIQKKNEKIQKQNDEIAEKKKILESNEKKIYEKNKILLQNKEKISGLNLISHDFEQYESEVRELGVDFTQAQYLNYHGSRTDLKKLSDSIDARMSSFRNKIKDLNDELYSINQDQFAITEATIENLLTIWGISKGESLVNFNQTKFREHWRSFGKEKCNVVYTQNINSDEKIKKQQKLNQINIIRMLSLKEQKSKQRENLGDLSQKGIEAMNDLEFKSGILNPLNCFLNGKLSEMDKVTIQEASAFPQKENVMKLSIFPRIQEDGTFEEFIELKDLRNKQYTLMIPAKKDGTSKNIPLASKGGILDQESYQWVLPETGQSFLSFTDIRKGKFKVLKKNDYQPVNWDHLLNEEVEPLSEVPYLFDFERTYSNDQRFFYSMLSISSPRKEKNLYKAMWNHYEFKNNILNNIYFNKQEAFNAGVARSLTKKTGKLRSEIAKLNIIYLNANNLKKQISNGMHDITTELLDHQGGIFESIIANYPWETVIRVSKKTNIFFENVKSVDDYREMAQKIAISKFASNLVYNSIELTNRQVTSNLTPNSIEESDCFSDITVELSMGIVEEVSNHLKQRNFRQIEYHSEKQGAVEHFFFHFRIGGDKISGGDKEKLRRFLHKQRVAFQVKSCLKGPLASTTEVPPYSKLVEINEDTINDEINKEFKHLIKDAVRSAWKTNQKSRIGTRKNIMLHRTKIEQKKQNLKIRKEIVATQIEELLNSLSKISEKRKQLRIDYDNFTRLIGELEESQSSLASRRDFHYFKSVREEIQNPNQIKLYKKADTALLRAVTEALEARKKEWIEQLSFTSFQENDQGTREVNGQQSRSKQLNLSKIKRIDIVGSYYENQPIKDEKESEYVPLLLNLNLKILFNEKPVMVEVIFPKKDRENFSKVCYLDTSPDGTSDDVQAFNAAKQRIGKQPKAQSPFYRFVEKYTNGIIEQENRGWKDYRKSYYQRNYEIGRTARARNDQKTWSQNLRKNISRKIDKEIWLPYNLPEKEIDECSMAIQSDTKGIMESRASL
ncbi:MAG: hypothetical protein COB67_05745 [SAR324 cluster bacterium]|uniref:Lipoprotein n=1 Tax=SAR324 cluster bacterium TaxID=2024889 RepID=A0A2A4T586_9DELT|nr:MAG: hypothetical protein COB67_05745 [SAR324 cluster bacterium]